MRALLPAELIEIVRRDRNCEALTNCTQRIRCLAALLRQAPGSHCTAQFEARRRFVAACETAVGLFEAVWWEHQPRIEQPADRAAANPRDADLGDLHLLITAGLLAIERRRGADAALILGCIRPVSEGSTFTVIAQAIAHFEVGDVRGSLGVLDRALDRPRLASAARDLMESFKAYLLSTQGGGQSLAGRILATSSNPVARRLAAVAMH